MPQKLRQQRQTNLSICKANGTDSVKEAPVEARDINTDDCTDSYYQCTVNNCPFPEFDEFEPSYKGPCHSKCYRIYEQCKAKETVKRSVEEAPVEARDINTDDCTDSYYQCTVNNCPFPEFDEFEPSYKGPCHSKCYRIYEQCKAKQTAKRSVEDTLIQIRDNHAGEVTDCYDDVADCKAKGGSIEKCYAPLTDCLWNLYYKHFA
ncbi:hypothetical protein V8C34DRAFT_307021 [Trichoderma compactum]